jgi:DNA-directed RNA polymerase specialized sigma24 family protein
MRLNTMLRSPMSEHGTISNTAHEHTTVFHARFSRSRALLHFIACRVLGSSGGAENAVQACWLRASRYPPKFECEGAFRSWLLRILIDEALALLRARNQNRTAPGNL